MSEPTFRGFGWAFPAGVDERGSVRAAEGVEAVNRSIELILGTVKGERLMRPDFGSDLHDFVFKPFNALNKGRMETAVKQALMTWEPRIRVLDVRVMTSAADPAIALIDIEYKLRASNTQTNLVYPFYLQGAGR